VVSLPINLMEFNSDVSARLADVDEIITR